MAHHSSKIFLLNRYQFYRLGTTLKQHWCPRESYKRDPATSLQKWEKYIQFIHSCEFFSIYKMGTKSTLNREIFPSGRKNVGENKAFYSNRVLFCRSLRVGGEGNPILCPWLDLNTWAEDVLLLQPPEYLGLQLPDSTLSSRFPHEMLTTGQTFPTATKLNTPAGTGQERILEGELGNTCILVVT